MHNRTFICGWFPITNEIADSSVKDIPGIDFYEKHTGGARGGNDCQKQPDAMIAIPSEKLREMVFRKISGFSNPGSEPTPTLISHSSQTWCSS